MDLTICHLLGQLLQHGYHALDVIKDHSVVHTSTHTARTAQKMSLLGEEHAV